MRCLSARTVAILAAAIPTVVKAQVLFTENFNDGAAGTRWHLTHGADNGLSDYAVSYNFNYSLLGIPNPIGEPSTIGAALDANTTATVGSSPSQSEGVNIYPNGGLFGADFTMRCWVWCQTAGASTNEEAMFGINTTGTRANWDSFLGPGTDGLWTGMAFDGNNSGNHTDYARYHGNTATDPDITDLYDNTQPVPQKIFRDPNGTPDNRWSMLEMRQVEGRYRVKVNGKSLDLFAATPPFFASGDIFLGHQDIPNSVNVNTFSIFDEVSVRQVERWKVITGGNWSVAGNWGNGVVPGATDSVAYFGPIITSPSTITLDGSRTVGAVIFDSTNSYTINGSPSSSSLDMFSAGPFSEIDNELGVHTINADIGVSSKLLVDVAEGATLTLNGFMYSITPNQLIKRDRGTLIIGGNNSYNGVTIVNEGEIILRNGGGLGDATVVTQVMEEARLTIDAVAGDIFAGEPLLVTGNGPDGNGCLVSRGGNHHVGAVTVLGSARTLVEDKSLTVATLIGTTADSFIKSGAGLFRTQRYRIGTLQITQGTAAGSTFRIADNTSRLSHLIIAPSSSLDLGQNDLIYDYDIPASTPLADVRAKLASGFNTGLWSGFGINSSNAFAIAMSADPHKTALGYAEASAVNQTVVYNGLPIDDTTLLIRYVYSGDANLDGFVNGLDFNALASHFAVSGLIEWWQGDFNYDTKVNMLDFNMLAVNFNLNLPTFSPLPGSAVPEPTGAVLAALAWMCCRRVGARVRSVF